MAQIGVILFVAFGILSTSSKGYELPSPKNLFSKVIDKANNFAGRQKQSDIPLEIPENAYPVELATIPFTCQNDGLFAFPEDCTLGLLCRNRLATVFTCTDIWHFNNITKTCDDFCSARCDPGLACSCGWDTCQTTTEMSTTKDLDVTREKPKSSIVCLEDGLYQDPTDCNLFAQCVDGTAYLMQCPPGLHFNIKKERCERPCDAACDPTLSCRVRSSKRLDAEEFEIDELSEDKINFPFICGRDGLFADRENCTQYIECLHGRSFLRSCPTGEHFNKKARRCDTPCNAKCDPTVSCPRKSSQTEETPSDEDFATPDTTEDSKKIFTIKVTFVCFNDGLFSYPKDCTKYVNCSSGNSYEQSCPVGLHFNSATKLCETPCSAKCDPTLPCKWRAFKRIIKESPEELCSKDGVYRERNPMDCKSYFRCESGDAELFHCSEGEHFNQETLLCEDACDAHCDPDMAEKCGWESTTESEDENSLTQPIFDFTCEENGLFENPHACENFIQCTGGHAYLINCQYGMHYNSETQRCMTPCEARCDPNYENFCKEEENNNSPKQFLRDFDCQTDGYHVDPLDCKNLIQCFRGSAYTIPCPPGLHYSPTLETCMSPCEAKCAPNYEAYCRAEEWSRIRSPQIRNPVKQPFPLVSEFCMQDGNYPNPKDCSSYIQCMMGQSFITHCPEGLHFNENTQQCESPCDAHCDSSIGDICGWEKSWTGSTEETSFNYDMFSSTNSPRLMYHFTCLRDGIYKNPENCSTFIQCSGRHSYLMACPEGLHFSEGSWRCEYPCDARCNASLACDCGWDTCSESGTSEVEVDCEIDPEVGPCKAEIPRYYYDTRSRRCRGFIYGGCGGNTNNFETREDCEEKCQKRISTQVDCELEPEVGPCKAEVPRYYYDTRSRRCRGFIYGGCGGNSNNFETREDCEDKCQKRILSEVEVDCEIEPEVGDCKAEIPRYYYDISSGRCRGFTYGGCGGNSNNFKTREDCEDKCQKRILRRFRCPYNSGRFGHFYDCTSYYHCKRGIPTLKKCRRGTAFDQTKSKCVTEYEATCVYQCREKDAVYPYEEDCRKYIDCVNGISKLETCPLGKAFDPVGKDCIDEKEVTTCFWPSETHE